MDNQTQTIIPPAQPVTQTPVPPPTNWLKIILFTILGFIVVGAVFVGINIGKKQTLNQQSITGQPSIIPTQVVVNPTAIPTTTLSAELNPTTNPTADWKTYKDVNYQFSYPTQWYISKASDDKPGNGLLISSCDNSIEACVREPNTELHADIMSLNNINGAFTAYNVNTLEDYIKKLQGVGGSGVQKKIIVDNIASIQNKWQLDDGASGITVFIPKKDSLIQISARPADSKYIDIFDKIISTFKFTN